MQSSKLSDCLLLCSERGREGRLTVLLDETRRNYHISRGFGVDENTALVVTHAESDAITGKVFKPVQCFFFMRANFKNTHILRKALEIKDSLSIGWDVNFVLITKENNPCLMKKIPWRLLMTKI